jgi:hypothetical protein
VANVDELYKLRVMRNMCSRSWLFLYVSSRLCQNHRLKWIAWSISCLSHSIVLLTWSTDCFNPILPSQNFRHLKVVFVILNNWLDWIKINLMFYLLKNKMFLAELLLTWSKVISQIQAETLQNWNLNNIVFLTIFQNILCTYCWLNPYEFDFWSVVGSWVVTILSHIA